MVDLDAWLPRSAARRPDHPALIGADGTVVTYAELHLRARRAAAVLHARGVGPGDRVALRLAPGTGFAACVHAVLGLGAAVVPIDLRLSAEEQAARAVGARTVVEEPLDGIGAAAAARLRRRGRGRRSARGARARPAGAGGPRRGRDRPAHLWHDLGAEAGRADGLQLALERARLGARARARPGRPLALHAAAQSRRRPLDPAAQRRLRHDGRAARAVRGLAGGRSARRSGAGRDARLARRDDAAAGARRRSDAAAGAALRADRRRPAGAGAGRARRRRRHPRRADLRHDRGLLASLHRHARRAGDGRPRAARAARLAGAGRRDPRRGETVARGRARARRLAPHRRPRAVRLRRPPRSSPAARAI